MYWTVKYVDYSTVKCVCWTRHNIVYRMSFCQWQRLVSSNSCSVSVSSVKYEKFLHKYIYYEMEMENVKIQKADIVILLETEIWNGAQMLFHNKEA